MEKEFHNIRFKSITRSLIDATYSLKTASPEFCVGLLACANETTFKMVHRKLRAVKRNRQWIRDFIRADGLITLISCVERIFNRCQINSFVRSIQLLNCLSCIKEVMNSQFGMEAVINLSIGFGECVQILAKGMYFNKILHS